MPEAYLYPGACLAPPLCAGRPLKTALASRRAILLFSSPLFLFVFLPILLGLYTLARPRYRNLVLLTASLLFYVWGEGAYVLVMIAIIAINYGLGRRVEMLAGRNRAKITVAMAVVVNLGLADRVQVFEFPGRSAQRGAELLRTSGI